MHALAVEDTRDTRIDPAAISLPPTQPIDISALFTAELQKPGADAGR